ncbi:MAG: zf-TFIIB domain-containing protein [Myxococcaceae bacterium]|nr:zf-TFIIB domain-containing protein [Myxococcaceae bacterium]
MNCPDCKSKTHEQGFEGSRGARVLLDVCHTCHGLWFDPRESFQLSANGVLQLFREVHGRRDQHHRLKEPLACPKCRAPLTRTNDFVRGNRFQYFRCSGGDGHFITFFQFLREKGIVRVLSPRELAELKKHVQRLQCSDCGGPISLARDLACPGCSAPICILDPKALGSTLGDLKQDAAVAGAVVDPAMAARILMDKMGMDSFYRRLDTHAHLASGLGMSSMAMGGQGEHSSIAHKVGEVAVETGVEVALEVGVETAIEEGVDLIDMGVGFFLDAISGIF